MTVETDATPAPANPSDFIRDIVAADLAAGIGEAMITPAGGLIVGIPAMFFYFFFKNRLVTIMSEMQKNTSFIVDILSGEVALAEDDARA